MQLLKQDREGYGLPWLLVRACCARPSRAEGLLWDGYSEREGSALPGPPDSFLTGANDSGTWDILDDLGPHGQFARSVPSRCALTAVLLTAKDTRASSSFSSSSPVVVVVVAAVRVVSLRYRKRILLFIFYTVRSSCWAPFEWRESMRFFLRATSSVSRCEEIAKEMHAARESWRPPISCQSRDIFGSRLCPLSNPPCHSVSFQMILFPSSRRLLIFSFVCLLAGMIPLVENIWHCHTIKKERKDIIKIV